MPNCQPLRRIATLSAHLASSSDAAESASEGSAGNVALIVGAGPGLSASCARLFSREGFRVAIAARNINKPAFHDLIANFNVRSYACDAADPESVSVLFASVARDLGGFPNLVLYNAFASAGGPITEIDADAVKKALLTNAFGAFNVAQHAARGMVARASGSIFFTGNSGSIKGSANRSSMAMGKFGLHGLAQSLARELAPKGVHVAHFPIDAGIAEVDANGEISEHTSQQRNATGDVTLGDRVLMLPDAAAETYMFAHQQHRSAWTFEFQLRTWRASW